jgi:hypothetical protein
MERRDFNSVSVSRNGERNKRGRARQKGAASQAAVREAATGRQVDSRGEFR